MGLKACPDEVLGASPNTLCSGYPKQKKRKPKYYFFSEQWSIKNVQRLPFGRLPAVHNCLILPLPNHLFFQEVILLMGRKGHAHNIKKLQNHTSPSVFKASCKMFCLDIVSASLLPTYKVLWSQHLEPFSAWQTMEYFKLKQVLKKPTASWTVTNTNSYRYLSLLSQYWRIFSI